MIKQAYDALAPGGWLEFQDGTFPMEYVDPPPENCAIKRWNELLIEGAEKAGRPWTNTRFYKKWFEEVGLEEVVERDFYWPIMPWAKGKYYKALGTFCQEDMLRGCEGMSLKVIGQLGWSAERIREFVEEVKGELRGTNVKVYSKM